MADIWNGKGLWSGWRLTTDHSASSHNQPVLVSPRGKAYGPGDIEDAAPKHLLRAVEVAAYLGISRGAVSQFEKKTANPNYRGKFPHPVEAGLWDPDDIERYKEERDSNEKG